MPEKKTTAFRVLWGIIGAVVVLAGLAGAIYGIDRYVEGKVERMMQNDDFMRRVATHVRPSVIFDQNASILADSGAMGYIDKIEADLVLAPDPQKIIVSPNRHLAYPPLLQSIDSTEWVISSARGKGYQWVYTIDLSRHEEGAREFRFRLEIIK